MSDELATRIDRLESRYDIEALVSNYCHGFDKRDYERFLAIWWDDCIWKIGSNFPNAVIPPNREKPLVVSLIEPMTIIAHQGFDVISRLQTIYSRR